MISFEILSKENGESVRDWTFRTILYNLVNLVLLPGAAVSENEVASVLGISRTPVRETFIRLTQEGLLDVYPQKGTYVSLVDEQRVEEGRYMRLCLERHTAELACDEMSSESHVALRANLQLQKLAITERCAMKFFALDEDFHRLIFAACDKERVWEAIRKMGSHFNRVRILSLQTTDWEKILQQHEAIVAAIAGRNYQKARDAMDEHLTKVYYDLGKLRQKYPSYFKSSYRGGGRRGVVSAVKRHEEERRLPDHAGEGR